jgi:chromosome segregation ATPase
LLSARDTEIGSLTSRMGDMSGLLDSVQAKNGTLTQMLTTKDGEIGSLTSRTAEMGGLVDSMTEKNGALTQTLTAKDNEIGTLSGRVGGLERQVSGATVRNDELQRLVGQRGREVEVLARRVSDLDTNLVTERERAATLEQGLALVKTDVDAKTAQFEKLRANNESLGKSLDAAREQLTARTPRSPRARQCLRNFSSN